MHEYDTALKAVLTGLARTTLRELTGFDIEQWRNVELPEVTNPRMDLLGEISEGRLVHIELQSVNDDLMPVRMADYGLRTYRQRGVFPDQHLLYVGEAPLRMRDSLDLPRMQYRYHLADIRDLDGDLLLESDAIGDNILAILTRVRDRKQAIRRVLDRIVVLDEATGRARLFRLLMVLSGLRKMGTEIEEEATNMPILNDINEHEVLGREYKRGLKFGVEQGMQQGMQQGELRILLTLLEGRFGSVPVRIREELAAMTPAELERMSLRILSAPSLDRLFESE